MDYLSADKVELQSEKEICEIRLAEISQKGLSLDLSRGKPSAEQLALSLPMLDVLTSRAALCSESGQDCSNYGGLEGIPEARRLLADMMGTSPENTVIGGNSSLNFMFQVVSHGMTDGICGGEPWGKCENRKFLCPAPGYDRHFAIAEHFGFELISVPMLSDGPNMDIVEELVRDPSVKGLWCVPKYQNPTGVVFSDGVVRRFAALKPAAKDFRLFWDNAYCVHGFDGEDIPLLDIISECRNAGNPDMVYEFCSTSKVTFPGSGISAVAASPANLADIKGFMQYATIGPDKLNQLMHARFFENIGAVKAHMARHAEIMRPKFAAAYDILERELAGTGIAGWTRASGGYFFSYFTLPHTASKIVKLCAKYGVKFTPAGATHPYGHDETDSDIRIAPSFATLAEIETAILVLALCTKLVSIEEIEK